LLLRQLGLPTKSILSRRVGACNAVLEGRLVWTTFPVRPASAFSGEFGLLRLPVFLFAHWVRRVSIISEELKVKGTGPSPLRDPQLCAYNSQNFSIVFEHHT